jgi:serine/threonine protein kinase
MINNFPYTCLPKTKDLLIPLSDTKPIYTLACNSNIFVKVIPGSEKTRKEGMLEIKLQKKAFNMGLNTPQIYDYYWNNEDLYIVMERIKGETLYDIYGLDSDNIPIYIWNRLREIIDELYSEGIEYVDITAVNFIRTNLGKIYIIDFGHAYISDRKTIDSYLNEFLDGLNEWNEYYL